MIEDTIASIESRLKSAAGLSAEQRVELQTLLGTLKSELAVLEKADADQARSVAGYVALSTHEATRASKDPKSVQHALEGLNSAVSGLEAQHPRLTELVNSLGMLLSNTGI